MKRGGFLKRKTSIKKTSKNPFSVLKKKLWKIFAFYIKYRDNWTCFTCGRKVQGSSANAGHFIPASVGGLTLYFNEDNVHCQCIYCNLNLEGNHYEYGLRLGPEKVAELYALKNKIVKWTPELWMEKIAYYNQKVLEYTQ